MLLCNYSLHNQDTQAIQVLDTQYSALSTERIRMHHHGIISGGVSDCLAIAVCHLRLGFCSTCVLHSCHTDLDPYHLRLFRKIYIWNGDRSYKKRKDKALKSLSEP